MVVLGRRVRRRKKEEEEEEKEGGRRHRSSWTMKHESHGSSAARTDQLLDDI